MPEPLKALIAGEQAEDVKQVTRALRRHFPGCRVEAVYSADEAIEWARLQEWHVIILDERIDRGKGLVVLPAVRSGAPAAAILVHSEGCDEERFATIIKSGADACLYRPSPAFLAELLAAAGGSLQKQGLHRRLLDVEARHQALLQVLPAVPYELEGEGRFLSVGAGIRDLLGYAPEELIGLPAGDLLPAEDRPASERLLRERRRGARRATDLLIRLLMKAGPGEPRRVRPVILNASGCYTPDGRFLGTVGHLRAGDEPAPAATGARPDIEASRPALTAHPQADERAHLPNRPPAQPEQAASTGGDRRRSPRVPLAADVHLTGGGQSWKGRIVDCSLHGLFLVAEGEVPLTSHQPVRVGLLNDVGLLELTGTIRQVRRHRTEGDPAHLAARGLAIAFDPLPELEAQVLASTLVGIREGVAPLRVTVALTDVVDERLLFEAGVQALAPRPATQTGGAVDTGVGLRAERRQTLRVRLALDGEWAPMGQARPRPSSRLTTVNLSLGGMRARVETDAPPPDGHIQVVLRAPSQAEGGAEAAASPLALAAEVVWASPEGAGRTRTVGLRFLPPAYGGLLTLGRLLDRVLTEPSSRLPDLGDLLLRSEPVACRNRQGRRLAVQCDHPRGSASGAPVVVIAPGFGETKRDYVRLACSLVQNGFRVVRYDHSHHVGDSEGEIRQTRLSAMRDDLSAVLDSAARAWPSSPLIVIAAGLAGLVALKVCAQQARLKLLALLGAVLDLRAALLAAQGEDLIGDYLEGRRSGEITLFGFNVEGDAWLEDAVTAGLTGLQTTVRDVAAMRAPIGLFVAEDGLWESTDALAAVEAALPPSSPRPLRLPGPPARREDRAGQSDSLCEQVVRLCRDHVRPFAGGEPIETPPEQAVSAQAALEAQRARLRHLREPKHLLALHRACLDRERGLPQVTEYWQLLDHIVRLLELRGGEARVLEAGCGNGHLGLFLRAHQAYRSHPGRGVPLRYVGVDLAPDAVQRASHALANRLAEPGAPIEPRVLSASSMATGLCVANLDAPLPFHERAFDRVVSNLVLDSLYDPLAFLRELVRVLRPGGRLVLTSLAPLADPLPFYRTRIHLAGRPSDREEGRKLLSAWGLVNEARRNGLFHSFSQADLLTLAAMSGAEHPRLYPTYAGQAYALVAEKPQ